MKEHQIRALIEDVRTGQMPRRSFIQQMVGVGLTAPMAGMMLMHAGIAQSQPDADLQADQARRRRRAEDAVVAGPDAAASRTSPTAPRTRRPRASSTSRSPSGTTTATSCRSSPPRFRASQNGGVLEGGKVVALATEAGREMARRQALHRRRLRLHLGIRARPGDRRGDQRPSTRTSTSRRSTTTRSWSRSRSRRRSGPTAFVGARAW